MTADRILLGLSEILALRDLQTTAASHEAGRAAMHSVACAQEKHEAAQTLEGIESSWHSTLASEQFSPEESQRWAHAWRFHEENWRVKEASLSAARSDEHHKRQAWGAAMYRQDMSRGEFVAAARSARRAREEAQTHETSESFSRRIGREKGI